MIVSTLLTSLANLFVQLQSKRTTPLLEFPTNGRVLSVTINCIHHVMNLQTMVGIIVIL